MNKGRRVSAFGFYLIRQPGNMKLSGIANKRIWKSRNLWAVILLGVFLIFFRPPVPDSIGQTFRCVFRGVTHLQSFKENLTTPHSGEQILPSSVQEMLALLRKHNLSSYRISRKIKEDWLLHQRIVESAWPRRMSGMRYGFDLNSAASRNNSRRSSSLRLLMVSKSFIASTVPPAYAPAYGRLDANRPPTRPLEVANPRLYSGS